jgi:hypothetical protein
MDPGAAAHEEHLAAQDREDAAADRLDDMTPASPWLNDGGDLYAETKAKILADDAAELAKPSGQRQAEAIADLYVASGLVDADPVPPETSS